MDKAYYAIIPADVRYDNNLTQGAKLLYGEITALCNEKGFCWATNSYFSQLYNVSERTIKRWIKDLIDNKYILSKIKFKDDGKEIEYRYLSINKYMDQNETTLGQKCHEGSDKNDTTLGQKCHLGGDKNVLYNNTIYNNTINNIYSHWNSKKIIVHRSINSDMKKAIEKALKKYSENEIVQAINIYSEILESEFYFNYTWSLTDFLNRKNGISSFMQDGSNTINYLKWKDRRVKNNEYTKGNTYRNRGRFNEGAENIRYKPTDEGYREYTEEERRAAGLE